jgi:hypothetical protein
MGGDTAPVAYIIIFFYERTNVFFFFCIVDVIEDKD